VSYEGTHLAVPAEQADALRRLHSDGDGAALRARVRELLTQGTGQFPTGRYWETIRRCLSGGELLDDPARRPLGDAVLGGAALFDRPGHVVRVVRLLPAEDVARTAAALAGVSADWLRGRFDALDQLTYPSPMDPMRPGERAWFAVLWERFAGLAGFFAGASRAGRSVLFVVAHLKWRPLRQETGPDGPYLIRRPFRPEDYTVDPNSTRSLPADGSDQPFEAELNDRDGVLSWPWNEVRRFTRGGRTWVRMTRNSADEYYIDVENADNCIGRIECVDPLLAYWEARQADRYPIVLEDW
jgi:hypothetical protein